MGIIGCLIHDSKHGSLLQYSVSLLLEYYHKNSSISCEEIWLVAELKSSHLRRPLFARKMWAAIAHRKSLDLQSAALSGSLWLFVDTKDDHR